MVKIKTKKQLNLPQLIEWAFERGAHGVQFKSDRGKRVGFRYMGYFWTECEIDKDDTFTLEVEEEITEDTVFEFLLEVRDGGTFIPYYNESIKSQVDKIVKEYHTYIDGEFKLIWRDGRMVE